MTPDQYNPVEEAYNKGESSIASERAIGLRGKKKNGALSRAYRLYLKNIRKYGGKEATPGEFEEIQRRLDAGKTREREIQEVGGSGQTQQQLRGLSSADYEAAMNLSDIRKRKKK